MLKRVGIAQALLNEPDILVLDEPTSGLDPRERVRFRNIISSISKDKIVLLSTHIVSDIEYIADRIILMRQGKVTVQGTVQEFIEPVLSSVWECDVDRENIDAMNAKFIISNLKNEENFVRLRIVSGDKPLQTAHHAPPVLEDAYLYYLSMKKEREHESMLI